MEVKLILSSLNESYKQHLLTEFMITLGDEFQGALKTPESAYNMYTTVENQFQRGFYCGIGVGDIRTPPSDRVVEMDGLAFYRSRKALDLAKRYGRKLVISTYDPAVDSILNPLLALVAIVRDNWTSKQREIVAYASMGSLTYSEIAKRVGVSKQSVSKVLGAAHWKEVNLCEKTIKSLLSALSTGRGLQAVVNQNRLTESEGRKA